MRIPKPALGINIKDFNPEYILGDKDWRITEKVDGVRRLFFKSASGKVTAWSRTGKQDPWLDHITSWLTQPHFPSNMIYDSELVDRDSYFANEDSFLMRMQTISKANTQAPDNKGDLMAICFDMVKPDGDMASGEERTKRLEDTFRGSLLSEPMIQVPIYGYIHGVNEQVIQSLMLLVEARKGEGLMLMSMDSPYLPGRSKELVKIKRLEEFIGTVIDIEAAGQNTKIAGGIASIICDVPRCTVPVKVGTGFTHELRREILNDPHIYGKKVEIEAFGLTKDFKGDMSLCMPVFKQFAA